MVLIWTRWFTKSFDELPPEVLAGVAEHGRPEVVVQPQQAVTRYPPHKDFYYTYEYMSKTFQHIADICYN